MRYLGIDLGQRRTGLAAGDDLTGLVAPLSVLEIARGPQLFQALIRSIREHQPHAIVIGLPINMDGSEGPAAKSVREFGQILQSQCGVMVHFQDERLSSFAADQRMAQTGRTHKQKKQLRDALAAAEILRDFLESRKEQA